MSPTLWNTAALRHTTRALHSLACTLSRSHDSSRHKLTILAHLQRGRRKSGLANLAKHFQNPEIGARPKHRKASGSPSAGEKETTRDLTSLANPWFRAIPRLRVTLTIRQHRLRAKTLNDAQAPSNQPNLNQGNAAVDHITFAVVPQPSPTSLRTTQTGAHPQRGYAQRAPNDSAGCREKLLQWLSVTNGELGSLRDCSASQAGSPGHGQS